MYAQMLLLLLQLAATAGLIVWARTRQKRDQSTQDKVTGDLAAIDKIQSELLASRDEMAQELKTVAQVLELAFADQRAEQQLTEVCSTGGHRIHRRVH